MSDVKAALHRQWQMLKRVPRWPATITAWELAEQLRVDGYTVSKRTVERDLQTLSVMWPLTADESSKPFRWSFAKGATTHLLPGLDAEAAVALAMARQHVRDLLPQALRDRLEPLYAAADEVMAQLGWKRWVEATAFVPATLMLRPAPVDTDVMAVLQHAIACDLQVELLYRGKWEEQPSVRRVTPLGVLMRGATAYLVACKGIDSEPRQYALHRIQSASCTQMPGTPPPGFDFQSYARSSEVNLVHCDKIELVLWFDPPAAEHLRETPLADDQDWRLLQDRGVVEVRATVADSDPLRWWILGFGDQVEVRSPSTLRNAVADALRGSLGKYQ